MFNATGPLGMDGNNIQRQLCSDLLHLAKIGLSVGYIPSRTCHQLVVFFNGWSSVSIDTIFCPPHTHTSTEHWAQKEYTEWTRNKTVMKEPLSGCGRECGYGRAMYNNSPTHLFPVVRIYFTGLQATFHNLQIRAFKATSYRNVMQ